MTDLIVLLLQHSSFIAILCTTNEKGALKKRAKQQVKTFYLRLMSAQVVVNLPTASTDAIGAISSWKLC